MKTSRHISLFGGVLNRNESEFTLDFLEKDSAEQLEKAIILFEDWWENVVEKSLSLKDQNQGYDAVYGLRDAYEQIAREDGIRTGLRLMVDAMLDTPSVKGIEFKERGSH